MTRLAAPELAKIREYASRQWRMAGFSDGAATTVSEQPQ